MKPIVALFACLLFTASAAQAQGVGSSGEIGGTVFDASGAVLSKVAVRAVELGTGAERNVVTDGSGHYRITGLSPTAYSVSVSSSGFATEIRRNVSVAIGQTVICDFTMRPSQVATVVEVMSE